MSTELKKLSDSFTDKICRLTIPFNYSYKNNNLFYIGVVTNLSENILEFISEYYISKLNFTKEIKIPVNSRIFKGATIEVYAILETIRIHLKSDIVIMSNNGNNDFVFMSKNLTPMIGVMGEIGCGKSTLVSYLSSKFNYTEYMFAGPLKEIAVCLGFDKQDVYGTQEDKARINPFWGVSGRRFMQIFGTEVCRNYLGEVIPEMKVDNTIWCKLFEKYVSENIDKRIIASDVRFIDESDTIRKYEGLIIKILRSNNQVDSNIQKHISEQGHNSISPNVIIINNDSLDMFFYKIRTILAFIHIGYINKDTRNFVI